MIAEGLEQVRSVAGDHEDALLSLALWACLDRYEHAVVLVGFTTPHQVRRNLAAACRRPSTGSIAAAREIMAAVQHRLDSRGEVFVDERSDRTDGS